MCHSRRQCCVLFVFIYDLFNDVVNSWDYVALKGTRICEYWIEKDVERNSLCIIWVISRHLLPQTEKYPENSPLIAENEIRDFRNKKQECYQFDRDGRLGCCCDGVLLRWLHASRYRHTAVHMRSLLCFLLSLRPSPGRGRQEVSPKRR
jgi:hypothetical protein